MPPRQAESQDIDQQRGGVTEEPGPLESPGSATSRGSQATPAGIGAGKKQPPVVEVIQPPLSPPVEFAAPLPRHQYSPGIIQLFIRGLLEAHAGQRCLAAVLELA